MDETPGVKIEPADRNRIVDAGMGMRVYGAPYQKGGYGSCEPVYGNWDQPDLIRFAWGTRVGFRACGVACRKPRPRVGAQSLYVKSSRGRF